MKVSETDGLFTLWTIEITLVQEHNVLINILFFLPRFFSFWPRTILPSTKLIVSVIQKKESV
jgi:hypothetical protein